MCGSIIQKEVVCCGRYTFLHGLFFGAFAKLRKAAISITCMKYTYCYVFSARLLMMDRDTCPKYVEFYSKNKSEKLVHLVGFIIRIYHDARSSEFQISFVTFACPSICLCQLSPTRRIFTKFDISEFFENLSRKFKFH